MTKSLGISRAWFDDGKVNEVTLTQDRESIQLTQKVGRAVTFTYPIHEARMLIDALQEFVDLADEGPHQHVSEAWLPIHTAPKTGVKLLGYLADQSCFEVIKWVSDDQCWISVLGSAAPLYPTHFMHIPDAPGVVA